MPGAWFKGTRSHLCIHQPVDVAQEVKEEEGLPITSRATSRATVPTSATLHAVNLALARFHVSPALASSHVNFALA